MMPNCWDLSSRWELWNENTKPKNRRHTKSGRDIGALMDLFWEIGKCPVCHRGDTQIVTMVLFKANSFLLRCSAPIEKIGPMCVRCHDWSKRGVIHPAFIRPENKYRKGQLKKAITQGLEFEPDRSFADMEEPPRSVGVYWRNIPRKLLADVWDITNKGC